MPTYTYRCCVCKHEWDQRSSIENRDDTRKCPKCGSFHTWRGTTSANFNVKGFNAKNGYARK